MKLWPFNRQPRTEEKSLSAPEDWLLEMFTGAPTSSGASVTVTSALCVPAVSSAIRVISEAAASLDVAVKDPTGQTETEVTDSAALPLLRDEANGWTSGYEFIRDLVIQALTRDSGGLAYVNRVDGRPVEIIQYRPGIMEVEHDAQTYEPTYRIGGVPVSADEVIHLRSPFGRAPLTLARESIGVAAVAERHAARLFGRGGRPSGVLKFPSRMGEAAVKATREAWRKAHEGDDAGGRTAVLYDDAEFTPLTFKSTDAQFLENRNFQILEIARAFRVPPSMLFQLDRATWSNTEQMGREFLVYCLEPWLRALEAALRRGLFLPEERATRAIRFERDDLTRASLEDRATTINSLIASQVISPNEGREWLGMQPRAGGDEIRNPNIDTGAGNGPD